MEDKLQSIKSKVKEKEDVVLLMRSNNMKITFNIKYNV